MNELMNGWEIVPTSCIFLEKSIVFFWSDSIYLSGKLFEQSSRSNSMLLEGKDKKCVEEKQVLSLIFAKYIFLEMYLTVSRSIL